MHEAPASRGGRAGAHQTNSLSLTRTASAFGLSSVVNTVATAAERLYEPRSSFPSAGYRIQLGWANRRLVPSWAVPSSGASRVRPVSWRCRTSPRPVGKSRRLALGAAGAGGRTGTGDHARFAVSPHADGRTCRGCCRSSRRHMSRCSLGYDPRSLIGRAQS